MTASSRQRRVLMIGPDDTVRGGMTSVIRSYRQHWDDASFSLDLIGTYTDDAGLVRKGFVFLGAYAGLLRRLFVARPAIVHLHASQRGSYLRKGLCALTAAPFGCRIIWHSHGSEFEHFYLSLGRLGQAAVRAVLNRADVIIVLSDQWKRVFERLGLRPPIVVLPNPVEIPPAESLPPFSTRKRSVLTLGRLGRRKGTYDILRAAPFVLQRLPDIEFWLAGDGEVEGGRAAAAELGLDDHVRFLGWIAGDLKAERLGAASVFLLPSYHEGAPVAILEAMAYGLPVVSTPVGGIAELVEEGVTGFLVPAGDVEAIAGRLLNLLGDVKLAERMGCAGRERVQRHSPEAIMAELYRLYDSVLVNANDH